MQESIKFLAKFEFELIFSKGEFRRVGKLKLN